MWLGPDAGAARATYPRGMKHSLKMMWGCVAIVAVIVVLAVAGVSAPYALFALPCVLMMGAMVWMMIRMSGGGSSQSH